MEDNKGDSIRLQERVLYCDWLRVMATFAVIILHVSAQDKIFTEVGSVRWFVANVWGNLVRWAVPIFFMISGTLFLQKERKIKIICTKNIFRLMTAYLFWSVIYALSAGGDIENIVANIVQGAYHMWFVPAIIGVYLCIPILQKITQSSFVMKYFLFLALWFVYIIPFVGQLLSDFEIFLNSSIFIACKNFFTNLNPYNFTNYATYFVLGFFLSKLKLNKKWEYGIYLLGLLGFALTIVLNSYVSIKLGNSVSNYQDSSSLNVLLTSIAIYVWVKNHSSGMEKFSKFIQKLSQYSFGAYLVHVAVMGKLESGFGVSVNGIPIVIAVPLLGGMVFAISITISTVLNHIPIIKRYIV